MQIYKAWYGEGSADEIGQLLLRETEILWLGDVQNNRISIDLNRFLWKPGSTSSITGGTGTTVNTDQLVKRHKRFKKRNLLEQHIY